MDETASYWAAAARLDALIDPVGPADRSLPAIWARAAAKLARARGFLDYLGNPHLEYPVVHVTGTSGKGSTCANIACMLTSGGYRVGLATSPYLQVATEKMQINGELIAPAAYAELVEEVLAAAERWKEEFGEPRPLSYGEIWVAMLATWFSRMRVDLAVIEVGAGGRFDVTNVVQPIVSVITSVGLDHTATLGPGIAQIAWHKAGIVKAGAPVVTGVTDSVAVELIRAEADAAGVELVQFDPAKHLIVHASGRDGIRWSLRHEPGEEEPFHSPQIGAHQAVNGALAVLAVRLLGQRGFSVSREDLQVGLTSARMPGRGERMPAGPEPPVVIDAAHNPDKIQALISSLADLWPEGYGDGAVLLTGTLAGKDARAMIKSLTPFVSAVVTTTAGVAGKEPMSSEAIARLVHESGFAGPVLAEPDAGTALTIALKLAATRDAAVLVTGSLFLAGRVRDRWYPAEEILRQRTPWPTVLTPKDPLVVG